MIDFIEKASNIAISIVSVAGVVAVFNAKKAVEWKRAEIAGTYLRDFYADPEVAFACRALEWYAGKLVVPECLRPLLPSGKQVLEHDFDLLTTSMTELIDYNIFAAEPRMQLYRTAMDSMFTRLSIISNAIENRLFTASDIREIGYWVVRIEKIGRLEIFIDAYGYRPSTKILREKFKESYSRYDETVLNKKM